MRTGAEALLPAALGEQIAAREYHASKSLHGLQAPNRAHGLRARFSPDGVRFEDRRDPAQPLGGLRLARLGRSSESSEVPPGALSHAAARVEIARPALGVTEWYVNSPRGLEHQLRPCVVARWQRCARARDRGGGCARAHDGGRCHASRHALRSIAALRGTPRLRQRRPRTTRAHDGGIGGYDPARGGRRGRALPDRDRSGGHGHLRIGARVERDERGLRARGRERRRRERGRIRGSDRRRRGLRQRRGSRRRGVHLPRFCDRVRCEPLSGERLHAARVEPDRCRVRRQRRRRGGRERRRLLRCNRRRVFLRRGPVRRGRCLSYGTAGSTGSPTAIHSRRMHGSRRIRFPRRRASASRARGT